ncbi:hypothetical protein HYALB_00001400 [Hymenoscyphus albidus]|uniref:WSC domain-containing protein n=1 Tax=Hymenoscyphus albidus TaxID=595503 RepID=A0A9N9Q2P2_9HELO|nr:hypothetical protein HYALB_00001400 [Hymenoscyphus albidus]
MFSSSWSSRWAFLAALWAIFVTNAFASVLYCSDLNTASTGKNSNIYQSNGLCSDFCRPTSAFAVVQGDGCWCSDYVPGTTTDGCDTPCPGYPAELCGGNSVFGYIALSNTPSGTKGAPSSAPATTAAPHHVPTRLPKCILSPLALLCRLIARDGNRFDSQQQVTVTATAVSVAVSTAVSIATPDPVTIFSVLTTDPPHSETSTAATTTAPNTPTSPPPPPPPPKEEETTSTTSTSSPTWTPTPIISLETVTGQVRTVTVTPTAPPNSLQNAGNRVPRPSMNGSQGGLSTGGAVGLTIGLIVLFGTVAAMIWYYMRKKKQERTEEDGYNNMSRTASFTGVLGGPTPSRTMSENSRYILGTNGREVIEAWEHDPPGSRKSGPLRPVDQRLDPFAPPYQLGDNRSRDSVNTIRDDHDYSRRVQPIRPILRVNNPD